jgi:hypothetical protein
MGEFIAPIGINSTTSVSVSSVQVLAPRACTLGNLRVLLSAAPATTSGRAFDINVNGTSAGFTCSIASGATTCVDTVTTSPVAGGGLISIHSDVQTADAAASSARISFTCD